MRRPTDSSLCASCLPTQSTRPLRPSQIACLEQHNTVLAHPAFWLHARSLRAMSQYDSRSSSYRSRSEAIGLPSGSPAENNPAIVRSANISSWRLVKKPTNRPPFRHARLSPSMIRHVRIASARSLAAGIVPLFVATCFADAAIARRWPVYSENQDSPSRTGNDT